MFLPICLPSSSRTEIPKGTWTSQSFPFSPFRALTLGQIKQSLEPYADILLSGKVGNNNFH